jgi:hypothetical protein
MDCGAFDEISERIRPFLSSQDEQKAINSSGAPIQMWIMLAVTLHWLASVSYLVLCFAWGISGSMFYHPKGALWPTLEAIYAAFYKLLGGQWYFASSTCHC